MSATETKALVERLRELEGDVVLPGTARTVVRAAADALEPLTREPDADEVERVAKAIHVARYQTPDDAREAPPLEECGRVDNEYCTRLARAAIAALPRRDASLREAL